MIKNSLSVIQIILSLALIVLIAIQNKSAGLGHVFGGGSSYSTRRGVEKVVFYATIAVAVLFFIASIAQLLI